MKVALCLFAFFVVVRAQYYGYGGYPPVPIQPYPPFPYPAYYYEQYAASLGGAKVGIYGKKHDYGYGPYGYPGSYGGQGYSEVNGASLSGAKVGIYGKEHN